MKPLHLQGVLLAGIVLLAGVAQAAELREDFATDPRTRGWEVQGDAAHFAWDAAGQRMGVTWDSTRPNAFFVLPLGTILTRGEDCRFAFTLLLEELRTASPESSFQIALGLIRRAEARATNFFRGAGVNPAWGPRNLLEFDYFPGSQSITPTFSGVAVGTNNLRWAMVNLFPLALTPGDRFHVEMSFTAADQRLLLAVTRNGAPQGSGSIRLEERFGDYRLDAFSLTSYSGDHQPAGYGGQVFARGWVDDVEVDFPDPPLGRLRIARDVGGSLGFRAAVVPGWRARLEHQAPGDAWHLLPQEAAVDGDSWVFQDPPSALQPGGFYRLVLDRP